MCARLLVIEEKGAWSGNIEKVAVLSVRRWEGCTSFIVPARLIVATGLGWEGWKWLLQSRAGK